MVIYYNDVPKFFPKDMTSCPDFWTVNPNGTCQIPTPGPNNEPVVNAGSLTRSQKTIYPIYTYEQIVDASGNPIKFDPSGKKLDQTLDVLNKSYLASYNDPGTIFKMAVNRIPKNITRSHSKQNGTLSENVYRYDISNNIPYGYSIHSPGDIDFNDRNWGSYGDPYCAIQSWVKENNIAWDSIIAYNKC
jgi:hypothetical protein